MFYFVLTNNFRSFLFSDTATHCTNQQSHLNHTTKCARSNHHTNRLLDASLRMLRHNKSPIGSRPTPHHPNTTTHQTPTTRSINLSFNTNHQPPTPILKSPTISQGTHQYRIARAIYSGRRCVAKHGCIQTASVHVIRIESECIACVVAHQQSGPDHEGKPNPPSTHPSLFPVHRTIPPPLKTIHLKLNGKSKLCIVQSILVRDVAF